MPCSIISLSHNDDAVDADGADDVADWPAMSSVFVGSHSNK